MDLIQIRDELAARTRRGIGMPLTGAIWWLALAVTRLAVENRRHAAVAIAARASVAGRGDGRTQHLQGYVIYIEARMQ